MNINTIQKLGSGILLYNNIFYKNAVLQPFIDTFLEYKRTDEEFKLFNVYTLYRSFTEVLGTYHYKWWMFIGYQRIKYLGTTDLRPIFVHLNPDFASKTFQVDDAFVLRRNSEWVHFQATHNTFIPKYKHVDITKTITFKQYMKNKIIMEPCSIWYFPKDLGKEYDGVSLLTLSEEERIK